MRKKYSIGIKLARKVPSFNAPTAFSVQDKWTLDEPEDKDIAFGLQNNFTNDMCK
jgi:hypothetical protein